jgi:hypothetical protein
MNTFILEIVSLGCHILPQSSKNIMNMLLIILGDLGILEIGALIYISPHLKEKIESHDFLMLAKSCKSPWIAKTESRSLDASLGIIISLEMIAMLTRSNMRVSHWMTWKATCV